MTRWGWNNNWSKATVWLEQVPHVHKHLNLCLGNYTQNRPNNSNPAFWQQMPNFNQHWCPQIRSCAQPPLAFLHRPSRKQDPSPLSWSSPANLVDQHVMHHPPPCEPWHDQHYTSACQEICCNKLTSKRVMNQLVPEKQLWIWQDPFQHVKDK